MLTTVSLFLLFLTAILGTIFTACDSIDICPLPVQQFTVDWCLTSSRKRGPLQTDILGILGIRHVYEHDCRMSRGPRLTHETLHF